MLSRYRRIFGQATLAGLALLAVLSLSPAARADDYSDGMAKFQARDYSNAAASFRKAIFDRPGDANCFYYYALSLHYARDLGGAKEAYQEIVQRYPQSDAAGRARQALAQMGRVTAVVSGARPQAAAPAPAPLPTRGGTSGVRNIGSGGGSSSGDIIPAQSLVNFQTENGHMVVEMALNGRRTHAIFDTGAESILFGRNHFEAMGLPAPKGPAVAQNRGVDGKLEDLQMERMDVTVGGVTRRNIPVHIKERMDTLPLLGLPFVQGMNYAVQTNSICFTNKSAGGGSIYAGGGSNSVPFTMEGRSMIVKVQVNGKDINMCFDTGANETLFSKQQADSIGLRVSEDSEVMHGSGVGGAVSGRYTNVSTIKLGPIQKRDFRVGVNDLSLSPYPLLGKNFWGDLRFTVDNDNHVLRFN